jgi:hypothetical protein
MNYFIDKLVLIIFSAIFVIKNLVELFRYKYYYNCTTLAMVLEANEICDSSYFNYRLKIEYQTENEQKFNTNILVSNCKITVGDKLAILYNKQNPKDAISYKGKYKDYQKEKIIVIFVMIVLSFISYLFLNSR